MVHLLTVVLGLLNLICWVGILFNLPGTWLMVLLASAAEWWSDEELFGAGFLVTAAGLALLGEILEFALSAAGSRQSGGTKRGALLAIVGGMIGAVLGTALPAPIIGTLIGASAGAFAGAILGDLAAGRRLSLSISAGGGAALGRLTGTLAKLIIGLLLVVAIAAAPYM